MNITLEPAVSLRGTLRLPADKAICHRAALLSALIDGPTDITPWSTAQDCQHTLAVLEGLGVGITRLAEGIRVQGAGLTGLRAPARPLPCGESGTTMRLASGLLAGQPFDSELTAQGSLAQRPMRRVIEPLSNMGAVIEGRQQGGDVHPPLKIHGRRPLKGIRCELSLASAQVKSAILLAGLSADGPTTVVEPQATRDHTERLMRRLGVRIAREGDAITMHPPAGPLTALGRLAVPADPSSAAFFLVAAALVPNSKVVLHQVGLNPSRAGFLRVLERMGASITVEPTGDGTESRGTRGDQWEPQGTLTAQTSTLRGTVVPPEEVPSVIDELPILMVAAAFAEGETRFEGLQELRVKETDRLHSITTGLARMGADLELLGSDGVVIRKRPLHGAEIDSFGDHRTAMSLAVAGLVADGKTVVRGAECVGKSLGNFFDLLTEVSDTSQSGRSV